MKHEEASYRTKKQLSEALKKAMQAQPFSKITVSQIIFDCGVNRKTFYYHFDNLYALLKWTFQQEVCEVEKHFALLDTTEEVLAFAMDYAEKNDHILLCAEDALGSDELKRFFLAVFMDRTRSVIAQAEAASGNPLESDYQEFLCHFYAGAISNLLTQWIKNREYKNRQALIDYFTLTIRGTILGISQVRSQASALQKSANNP